MSFGEDTTTYRTTGQGARLDVGGRLHPNGFQVNTGNGGVTLMWPTHDRYTSLSAQIGMDGLGTATSSVATVSFVDSTYTRIPFTDRGNLVFSASVPTTGFLSVAVPIAHLSEVLMGVVSGVRGAGMELGARPVARSVLHRGP